MLSSQASLPCKVLHEAGRQGALPCWVRGISPHDAPSEARMMSLNYTTEFFCLSCSFLAGDFVLDRLDVVLRCCSRYHTWP